MSAGVEHVDPLVDLARAHAVLDRLDAMDSTALSDDALLDYAREKERLRRRLASSDHALVLEIERRDLPGRNSVRPVPFLRGLLRLDPYEAGARIRAAEAAGPRRALTGEPLPPIYPEIAAAQAVGGISERHAKIVLETVEKLPDEIQAEHGEEIEADLVGYAKQFDPHHLARLAKYLRYCYDQDGKFNEVDYRNKVRELTITARPDGSSTIKGEATAELTEFLLTTIDALGKPLPEIDGVKDPRTAAQRRHDALLDALKINVRARELPSIAAVTATVVLTMSAEDFEARKGLARTGHGALIPVPEAIRITGNEYRLMNVVIDKTKGVTAYSSLQRLYTEQQRLALAALDGGCTFPNCPAPPGWCEIDHFNEWAIHRRTRVDDGLLGCRAHNVKAKQQGWTSTRINGRAAWIPPKWIDPEQKPRYNELHRIDLPVQD